MQNFNFRASPAKQPKLTKSGAETIAVEVLAFLAKDPARFERQNPEEIAKARELLSPPSETP